MRLGISRRLHYVSAKRIEDVVRKQFELSGFPFVVDQNVIPEDDSTLFICSGMQRLKQRFLQPDGGKYGSLQSCIRTSDLEHVGDGSHLTYFEMVGNFSFGRNDYEVSVDLWDRILRELRVPVSHVNVHPSRVDHRKLWTSRGHLVRDCEECEWTDGDIGGQCCEVFFDGLEIGNLVNPLGHSTDVGFGWERLHMLVEGKRSVGDTSLFRQDLHPIVSDHIRTLTVLWRNGVRPGGKGRGGICRRLLRRILDHELPSTEFDHWIEQERKLREDRIRSARRCWKRFRNRPPQFWLDTFGIMPEEIRLLS